MDDLKKQAEELGIKIDGRWSEERLQQEIDKALTAPAVTHEEAGTAPDEGAVGHELVGREPFGGKGDHDGDGKAGGSVKGNLVTVRVMRDFWVESDNDEPDRIRKGRVIEVPVEAALDGVESGSLSRVKG